MAEFIDNNMFYFSLIDVHNNAVVREWEERERKRVIYYLKYLQSHEF